MAGDEPLTMFKVLGIKGLGVTVLSLLFTVGLFVYAFILFGTFDAPGTCSADGPDSPLSPAGSVVNGDQLAALTHESRRLADIYDLTPFGGRRNSVRRGDGARCV